jgi:hypothetical protein
MSLKHLFVLAALVFGLAACGTTEGDTCSTGGDCDSDQLCSPIAFCTSDNCPGTCALTCSTDEECGSDQNCELDANGDRVCRTMSTVRE